MVLADVRLGTRARHAGRRAQVQHHLAQGSTFVLAWRHLCEQAGPSHSLSKQSLAPTATSAWHPALSEQCARHGFGPSSSGKIASSQIDIRVIDLVLKALRVHETLWIVLLIEVGLVADHDLADPAWGCSLRAGCGAVAVEAVQRWRARTVLRARRGKSSASHGRPRDSCPRRRTRTCARSPTCTARRRASSSSRRPPPRKGPACCTCT